MASVMVKGRARSGSVGRNSVGLFDIYRCIYIAELPPQTPNGWIRIQSMDLPDDHLLPSASLTFRVGFAASHVQTLSAIERHQLDKSKVRLQATTILGCERLDA